MERSREYAWPTRSKPKPASAKKPAAKPKPKPVGYLVTLQGGTQFEVDGNAKGFEGQLLREGVTHEGAWYPPHAVFRVERRTG